MIRRLSQRNLIMAQDPTKKGEEAAKALQKVIELTNQIAGNADALNDNISERIEACEDLKKILKDAQDAQRNSYKQWRASD